VAEELLLRPAEGIGVVWSRAAAGALARGDGEPDGGWRLDGSLDPGYTALRVITAATADGSALFICAARPEGAAHHDEEAVAATLVDPDGVVATIEEALISTEYGSDGAIRRLGLELYKGGDDYPVRAAGDAAEDLSDRTSGSRHDRARLRFRLAGNEGVALYEIVHRA
jgi:hypothetical protein